MTNIIRLTPHESSKLIAKAKRLELASSRAESIGLKAWFLADWRCDDDGVGWLVKPGGIAMVMTINWPIHDPLKHRAKIMKNHGYSKWLVSTEWPDVPLELLDEIVHDFIGNKIMLAGRRKSPKRN